MLFRVKIVCLGHEVYHYMVCIAYCIEFTELYCKFTITCKSDAFVAKIANTGLTNVFVAFFALVERLPTSATLKIYLNFATI